MGSFTCDVGMVYFQEEHSVVRKWILLSNNEDQHDHHGGAGSASGFVQINAIVLGKTYSYIPIYVINISVIFILENHNSEFPEKK